MAAVTLTLSGGPHGGTEHTFQVPDDAPGVVTDLSERAPGTTADLPSERPGRVERYEIRQQVDGYGEPVEGLFAIFIGTVRV